MDYLKEYKNFINSHYFSEGVRMTAGIITPALVLNHFGQLNIGIVVSLGAMCVSITDTPGPIHHRKNGMAACIIINFFIAIITGFVGHYPILMGLYLMAACFIFSMAGVYGPRANSVGVSALLILVLNLDRHHEGWQALINALFILAGGVWYMLLSLSLYSFRPYRLARQALGDCILATSEYLRARAEFYNMEVDYDKTYSHMFEEQIRVLEKQNLIRELLFKTRSIVRESTNTGRVLVMIFLDVVDLFERAMTSHHDYKVLHGYFPDDDILPMFKKLILELSNELDKIGLAVKSGDRSDDNGHLSALLQQTHEAFDALRDARRTADNMDGFIGLRQILNNIDDFTTRIHTLHLLTGFDMEVKPGTQKIEYDKFITHQSVDLKLLPENLTLKSNTFRHAIRVSLATITAYIISHFFEFGHSYWLLLTTIVILKPAYSLTKKRNSERLIGTLIGSFIGLVVLYLVHDATVLFVIMLLLMVGAYSLLRTHYMLSVLFLTPYIMVLFHLLNRGNYETIIMDRVVDTAIASGIAFIFNLLILPAWEHEKIRDYMARAIEDNKNYFADISAAFIGKMVSVTQYKLSRKDAFVSLANLSDAFTRMLSEPKRKQINGKHIHQFVVLSHMLTSHIAALSYCVAPLARKYKSDEFEPVIGYIVTELEEAEKIIHTGIPSPIDDKHLPETSFDHKIKTLVEKRKKELRSGITNSETRIVLSELKPISDQFSFISNIAFDLKKVSLEIVS